ncbi:hypothetical protein COOONC_12392, partial [Cooperia oncophora]
MTSRKAQKLMNRLHLTRKVHALAAGLDKVTPMLKLCSAEAMPSGWTTQHDKELISVCDQHGIDNISANILKKPAFQKIIRPTEKTLLRRVIEVCTTVETGKWNGTASTDSVDDSDAEERVRAQQQVRRGRKRAVDTDAQKMRALMQQSMLSQMGDLPLAAAMLQSAMFMPQLMGNNAAAAQLLGSLFAMAAGATGTTASSSGAGGSFNNAETFKAEPAVVTTASPAPSTSSAPGPSNSQQQQQICRDGLSWADDTHHSSQPTTWLTGALLPASKWPTLSKLAILVVGMSHPERLGGDPVAIASAAGAASSAAAKSSDKAASSSSVFGGAAMSAGSSSAASAALAAEAATKQQLEALQMQMLMQQTLLQQSLLGFNPYALAGSTSGTSSANAK